MQRSVCQYCGNALRPQDRLCPFCRMPISAPRSAPIAPSPGLAPSPPAACPRCQAEYALPRRVPIPQEAGRPVVWEAYICRNCGRVELYEPRKSD